LVALGACLGWVTHAQAQGATAPEFVPVTMLITAGLFAVASLPTFLVLRERARPAAGRIHFGGALAQVRATVRDTARYADLRRFLVCLVFYQAGIQAVIALAAVYAQQVMGFTTSDTLGLVLLVNITAAAGAFAFGYVQDRLGHVRTIVVTLAGWLATVVLVAAVEGRVAFWVAANLVGVCLGSSQSAGRALVGYLSPPARTAEFFGLWGLAVKLSAILGPVTYGVVTWLTLGNHRMAILAVGVYFVVGLALVAGLDVKRGRASALRGNR
jgi:UMF1 family MFS transporter